MGIEALRLTLAYAEATSTQMTIFANFAPYVYLRVSKMTMRDKLTLP